MKEKVLSIFVLVLLIPMLSGCVALIAGAGGTAFWQAGKVISEESVSMEKGVKAVESTFHAKNITITEKVTKSQVTQLRGRDQANTKVAVDVFYLGPKNAKFEIRYGLGEETPAREIFKCN